MPGKFEGEKAYAEHFYQCWLDGGTSDREYDEDGVLVSEWDVTPEDVEKFPELRGRKAVAFVETEQGFWTEVEPRGEVGSGSRKSGKKGGKAPAVAVGSDDEQVLLTHQEAFESAKKKVLAYADKMPKVSFQSMMLFEEKKGHRVFAVTMTVTTAALSRPQPVSVGAYRSTDGASAIKKAKRALKAQLNGGGK